MALCARGGHCRRCVGLAPVPTYRPKCGRVGGRRVWSRARDSLCSVLVQIQSEWIGSAAQVGSRWTRLDWTGLERFKALDWIGSDRTESDRSLGRCSGALKCRLLRAVASRGSRVAPKSTLLWARSSVALGSVIWRRRCVVECAADQSEQSAPADDVSIGAAVRLCALLLSAAVLVAVSWAAIVRRRRLAVLATRIELLRV